VGAAAAWRSVRVRRVGAALLAAVLGACGSETGSRASPSPAPLTREQAVREAVRITAAAQLEVMRSVRPGMREGDVKAVVERVFQREGASGAAFAHIVATGAHAVDAHYFGDDGVLADGDLVVVDIGASRDGWASDLTRTIPVSGRFSSRQRELYALALEGQELAARRAHTGVDSLQAMQEWVTELYRASPLRAVAADRTLQTLDSFNPYRLGHYMGRDVHGTDTGWDWQLPLEPGQALTIEPGMYLPAEAIGLRVEDDYWVGSIGLECLSCALPRWPEEIEAVMDVGRAAPAVTTFPPPSRTLPLSPWSLGRPHMQLREPDDDARPRPAVPR
jgi:Xaa-Pro aminopeptidase